MAKQRHKRLGQGTADKQSVPRHRVLSRQTANYIEKRIESKVRQDAKKQIREEGDGR